MNNIFICAICSREFKNTNGLYRHAHNAHNFSIKEYYDRFIESTTHKCPYCDNERTWHGNCYLQTCSKKECKLKNREDKIFKKYGVRNISQSPIIKAKKASTCLKHFGVDVPAKSADILKKMGDTCEQKYGVRNIYQLEKYKEKSRKVREENKEEWVAKYMETNRRNHGGVHYFQTLEAQKNKFKKIEYNGKIYDSSWEVAFVKYLENNGINYEYHPCSIEYSFNGESHYYFPDFKIDGKLVEIKGDHLFESMKQNTDTIEHAKYQCMLNNEVVILTSKELTDLGIQL